MSVSVSTIGQRLTQQQCNAYYNSIGNVSYEQLRQIAQRLYGMDLATFEVWLGWGVNESYSRANGAYEGYLSQAVATNLYEVYSNHTASDLAYIISGYGSDPRYTVSYLRGRAQLARDDQYSYQPDLRCGLLALANPDQRSWSCYGGGVGTLIYSFIDGWNGNLIEVREDPNGVRTYPYVQNGGVFGGVPIISFTQRNSPPDGTFNPCYMTNLYGASWSNNWNTCIYGEYPPDSGTPVYGANVLANCTGYAQGRALEIYNECMNYNPAQTQTHPFVALNADAGQWYGIAQSIGFVVNPTEPALGAIICWGQVGKEGHVAVVEEIVDSNTIITTESGYGAINGKTWIRHYRYRGDGSWKSGTEYTMGLDYYLNGFIFNPANPNMPFPEPDPIPEAKKNKMWMYMKSRNLKLRSRGII